MVGISIGWNCTSASWGASNGIRGLRANGYNTCPFDEMNSNMDGLLACILDDFKYFTDPTYLKIVEMPSDVPYHTSERLLVNTYYGFIFNHESPGHADLYISQGWEGGINHFVDNNFQKFIERYQRRINNFREYLRSGEEITFISTRNTDDHTRFEEIVKLMYPDLKFNITHIQDSSDKFDEIHKLMDYVKK